MGHPKVSTERDTASETENIEWKWLKTCLLLNGIYENCRLFICLELEEWDKKTISLDCNF